MLNCSSAKPIKIKCDERSFAEFPDLLFGTDGRVLVFDATKGIAKYPQLSIEKFFQAFEFQIDALLKTYGFTEAVYQNTDGHILLDSRLVYMFASYISPDFIAHLNDRIDELFERGICISDTYLLLAAKERLSSDYFTNTDDKKEGL
jgi:hypothetical protein